MPTIIHSCIQLKKQLLGITTVKQAGTPEDQAVNDTESLPSSTLQERDDEEAAFRGEVTKGR